MVDHDVKFVATSRHSKLEMVGLEANRRTFSAVELWSYNPGGGGRVTAVKKFNLNFCSAISDHCSQTPLQLGG